MNLSYDISYYFWESSICL